MLNERLRHKKLERGRTRRKDYILKRNIVANWRKRMYGLMRQGFNMGGKQAPLTFPISKKLVKSPYAK